MNLQMWMCICKDWMKPVDITFTRRRFKKISCFHVKPLQSMIIGIHVAWIQKRRHRRDRAQRICMKWAIWVGNLAHWIAWPSTWPATMTPTCHCSAMKRFWGGPLSYTRSRKTYAGHVARLSVATAHRSHVRFVQSHRFIIPKAMRTATCDSRNWSIVMAAKVTQPSKSIYGIPAKMTEIWYVELCWLIFELAEWDAKIPIADAKSSLENFRESGWGGCGGVAASNEMCGWWLRMESVLYAACWSTQCELQCMAHLIACFSYWPSNFSFRLNNRLNCTRKNADRTIHWDAMLVMFHCARVQSVMNHSLWF